MNYANENIKKKYQRCPNRKQKKKKTERKKKTKLIYRFILGNFKNSLLI